MKQTFVVLFFLSLASTGFSQIPIKSKNGKGDFYFYWGWNRAWYGDSDIHFKGNDYDFTLRNVKAKDRQTPFSIKKYLNPGNVTIPQYNFRVGYYFKDNYSISIGVDHMKYVVIQNQQVLIDGTISNSSTKYDGVYLNDEIELSDDFLQFEHTNGLNYLNADIRRDFTINPYKKGIKINFITGLGFGI